jgi:hypothetical protein
MMVKRGRNEVFVTWMRMNNRVWIEEVDEAEWDETMSRELIA